MAQVDLAQVRAGEYEDDKSLGVFIERDDAEDFARRYNEDRGYGSKDSSRARVELIPVYSPGDSGQSGHQVSVTQTGGTWDYSCTCGRWDRALTEPAARELAAEHLRIWTEPAPQPALPVS
ncbi:hypothetical protein JNW90_24190 [Micromonospora sp. STR1s_5]|nr:hypothetical protein [Micromonospora sp. STR1s_5]